MSIRDQIAVMGDSFLEPFDQLHASSQDYDKIIVGAAFEAVIN